MFAQAGSTSQSGEDGFFRGSWSHSGRVRDTEHSESKAWWQVKIWFWEVQWQFQSHNASSASPQVTCAPAFSPYIYIFSEYSGLKKKEKQYHGFCHIELNFRSG